MNYHHCLAIIPFYGDDGSNRTLRILTDGSKEVLDLPIKSYITRMYYHAHIDPRSLRFWTHKIIGTKLNTPITLSSDYIFIPIKIRHAIGKSDGCFGYVLNPAITSYDDYQLTLNCTTILSTLSTKAYISGKQRDAKLLSYAYQDEKKSFEFMIH